jgi:hypothetical protein
MASIGFEVTVQQAGNGWDHFANAWEVLASDGSVLATRTLLHPHSDEQPFALAYGRIPDRVSEVVMRAHDSLHGHGGKVFPVALPPKRGEETLRSESE